MTSPDRSRNWIRYCTLVPALAHPGRRIEAHSLAGHARHDERDAPPVRGRPAGVSRPVGQDHVPLALASLAIGLSAMVADERLGVGLRQPASRLTTSEPLQHRLAHYPTRAPTSHNEIGRRVAPTAAPLVVVAPITASASSRPRPAGAR